MTRSQLLPLLALPFLLGASDPGCDDPSGSALEDNFDEAYEWRDYGCADVTMYASADSDSIGIVFLAQGYGFVADAQDSGDVTTYTIDFSQDSGVSLEVWAGTRVTEPLCNDVVVGETEVESRYTAIGGIGTLVITPDPDASEPWDIYADGTLFLEGVIFVDENGQTTRMDDFGPLEAGVGWLPG